ncbi:hypothetical protein COP2_037636 [Malus domestica]
MNKLLIARQVSIRTSPRQNRQRRTALSEKPSMATESPSPSSKAATLILVLLLLATLYSSCHGSDSRIRPDRDLSGTQRRNSGGNQSQIQNCNDMCSESQCSRNPKCRWCRSDVLNDMCFPKLEALRLPLQVFTCKIDYSRLGRNRHLPEEDKEEGFKRRMRGERGGRGNFHGAGKLVSPTEEDDAEAELG